MQLSKRAAYTPLQLRVWRWHFFAGLMVIPFAIILSLSGAIYLFKPQITAYQVAQLEKRASQQAMLSADALVASALAAVPGSQLKKYFVPPVEQKVVKIAVKQGSQNLLLWLDAGTGQVLQQQASNHTLLNWLKNLHGELLAGNTGSYVVELMACWMIVLLVSGIYLWWPRMQPGQSLLANLRVALFPPLSGVPKRERWRNLHGGLGIWFSLLVLVFLLTGLPWTQLWGAGFDRVQGWFGLNAPGQEWRITLQSKSQPASVKNDGLALWSRSTAQAGQVNLESSVPASQDVTGISIQQVIDKVRPQKLAQPLHIQPPRGENGVWSVRSLTAYRPDRVTVHYDQWTGEELMRIDFNDYNGVKQVVGYGLSFHEGAWFGWLNQLVGVLVALGIVAMSISGALIWWWRRPTGRLAAPRKPARSQLTAGVTLLVFSLAILLPMVAISLSVVLVLEWLWQRVAVRVNAHSPT